PVCGRLEGLLSRFPRLLERPRRHRVRAGPDFGRDPAGAETKRWGVGFCVLPHRGCDARKPDLPGFNLQFERIGLDLRARCAVRRIYCDITVDHAEWAAPGACTKSLNGGQISLNRRIRGCALANARTPPRLDFSQKVPRTGGPPSR